MTTYHLSGFTTIPMVHSKFQPCSAQFDTEQDGRIRDGDDYLFVLYDILVLIPCGKHTSMITHYIVIGEMEGFIDNGPKTVPKKTVKSIH